MRTHSSISNKMLEVAVNAITHGDITDRAITFKSESHVVLCSVGFDSLIIAPGGFVFKDSAAQTILRSVVSIAGIPTNFSIAGKVDVDIIDNALTGTVGNLYSDTDFRFNKTNWVLGASITLSNVKLRMN